MTSLALRYISHAIAKLPEETDSARESFRSAFILLMSEADTPADAFRAAFDGRDESLLRAVFAQWPDENWTRIQAQAKSTRIGTLIHEQNYGMLLACRDAGIIMGNTLHLLIEVALRHDDPEPIRILREEFAHTDLIWKQNDFDFSILQCKPRLAPLLWEEMQIHLQNLHGRAMQSFTRFRTGYTELKPFAALLASGRDITPLFRSQMNRMHPHLASLVQNTASKHGQLA